MSNSGFDTDDIEALFKRARKSGQPFPFAFGLGRNPQTCALVVHMRKPPKTLVTAVKKSDAAVKKICFGTFTVEGKLVQFLPNRNVKGLVRQLRKRFREEGLLQFRPILVDESGAEIDEDSLPDEDANDATDGLLDGDDAPQEQVDAAESAAQSDGGAAVAALQKRLAAAKPDVAALEGKARTRMADLLKSGVQALIGNDLSSAERKVELLERGLAALKSGQSEAAEEPAAHDPLKIWRDAKELADFGVSDLQKALRGIDHPDLKRIAEMGLNGITDGNQVALAKALFEYNSAQGPARDKSAEKLRAQVGAYRSFISNSNLITLCEQNPFGVSVSIRAPLDAALTRIERVLAA